MAVGVVFVYKTPGYAPNLMTYLFGNILLVTRRDLLAILILSASVLATLFLFFALAERDVGGREMVAPFLVKLNEFFEFRLKVIYGF